LAAKRSLVEQQEMSGEELRRLVTQITTSG